MRSVCSWCNKDLGETPGGPPDMITHGICKPCTEWLRLEDFLRTLGGAVGLRIVVLRPQHDALLRPIHQAFQGTPPFQIITDRRQRERRSAPNGPVVPDLRSGSDRRQPRPDVLFY